MTTTTVCNVRVKSIRPKYDNLREWCDDPQNVYIGRKGVVFIDGERFPKHDSLWANPYKIDAQTTREEAIKNYRLYITNHLALEPSLRSQLSALRGKNLGCWCAPDACHGDVLIALLAEEGNK